MPFSNFYSIHDFNEYQKNRPKIDELSGNDIQTETDFVFISYLNTKDKRLYKILKIIDEDKYPLNPNHTIYQKGQFTALCYLETDDIQNGIEIYGVCRLIAQKAEKTGAKDLIVKICSGKGNTAPDLKALYEVLNANRHLMFDGVSLMSIFTLNSFENKEITINELFKKLGIGQIAFA